MSFFEVPTIEVYQCHTQEWLEEWLTDDWTASKAAADPRVPFITLAVSLGFGFAIFSSVAVILIKSKFQPCEFWRRSMNAAMRLLYRGGAWLPSADAAAISQHGLQHLRSVYKCAQLSLTMRQPRFPIHSKMHMLHHTFQFLVPWLCPLGFPLSWMHELHFFWLPLPI